MTEEGTAPAAAKARAAGANGAGGDQAGAPDAAATVADVLAGAVARAGVSKAFGVPGGEVLPVMEALRRVGCDFVLCNHESSAGMMASAYGKLTGAPGMVITTLGPGAANLLLPLANADLDREALLAVCGDLPASWPRGHTHQRLDLARIFGPVTKECAALRPEGAAADVDRALTAVRTRPYGAALLSISSEDAVAASAPTGGDAVVAAARGVLDATPERVLRAQAQDDADRLAARLARAAHPLVVVGLGFEGRGAPALRTWLDAWELPSVVTPKAKGTVGEECPRFVGVIDAAGLGATMGEVLAGADLIVGLGLDPVELMRTWHATSELVWVGDCGPPPGGGEPCREGEERLTSPAAEVAAVLAGRPPPRRWDDDFRRAREQRLALAEDPSLVTWIPRVMRRVLPAEGVLTVDVGSHKCLFGQFWRCPEPDRFFVSNGLSAMGYGLPAAIGAKLARPDLPVVAVVGDGGFAMAAQELETASRMAAAVVVVVLTDSSLSLIRLAQEARGLPRYGVDYHRVDVVRIAEGYGATGIRAVGADELHRGLERALGAGGPVVVEVPVDVAGYRAVL